MRTPEFLWLIVTEILKYIGLYESMKLFIFYGATFKYKAASHMTWSQKSQSILTLWWTPLTIKIAFDRKF